MLKKTLIAASAITLSAFALTACGSDSDGGADSASDGGGDSMTMGFAQVGAESGWRTANTKSIQDSAKEAGVDLKFTDAQGKQENQIQAIRSYIQQKVDVIAFSPVVETGWDAVLQEAKAANIPVILTDRAVDSKDTSLYKSFLGSDFVVEGNKAGQWVVDNADEAPERRAKRIVTSHRSGSSARSGADFHIRPPRSALADHPTRTPCAIVVGDGGAFAARRPPSPALSTPGLVSHTTEPSPQTHALDRASPPPRALQHAAERLADRDQAPPPQVARPLLANRRVVHFSAPESGALFGSCRHSPRTRTRLRGSPRHPSMQVIRFG